MSIITSIDALSNANKIKLEKISNANVNHPINSYYEENFGEVASISLYSNLNYKTSLKDFDLFVTSNIDCKFILITNFEIIDLSWISQLNSPTSISFYNCNINKAKINNQINYFEKHSITFKECKFI